MGIFDRQISRFLHALRSELINTLNARDHLPLERYDLDLLNMIDRLGGFPGAWSGAGMSDRSTLTSDGWVFEAARRG